MPGTILGSGDAARIKIEENACFHGAYSLVIHKIKVCDMVIRSMEKMKQEKGVKEYVSVGVHLSGVVCCNCTYDG